MYCTISTNSVGTVTCDGATKNWFQQKAKLTMTYPKIPAKSAAGIKKFLYVGVPGWAISAVPKILCDLHYIEGVHDA